MLKLKEGFLMRTLAGERVVLPSGDTLDLNMMITLNETGAFLWERLQNGTTEADLTAALLQEYDVDEPTARKAVEGFVAKLDENGFLENERTSP